MESNRNKVAGAIVTLLVMLEAGAGGAQVYAPPPNWEFMPDNVRVNVPKSAYDRNLWVKDWTQDETDAMYAYMYSHVSMRKWIESKSGERPFGLGTIFQGGGQWRRCDDTPPDPTSLLPGNWDCTSTPPDCSSTMPEDTYCFQDDTSCACDPRKLVPFPDDAYIPLSDYDAFAALHAFDFNFVTFAEVGTTFLARRKDLAPYYNLMGEQLPYAQANNMRTAGVHLIGTLPPWMVHRTSTAQSDNSLDSPLDIPDVQEGEGEGEGEGESHKGPSSAVHACPKNMAKDLLKFVADTIDYYNNDPEDYFHTKDNPIKNWVVAGEMARLDAPPVILSNEEGEVTHDGQEDDWTFHWESEHAPTNHYDGDKFDTADSGDCLGTIPLPEVTLNLETDPAITVRWGGGVSYSTEPTAVGDNVIEIGSSVFALVDDEIVEITGRDGFTLHVRRMLHGTETNPSTPSKHFPGARIYTIKDIIRPDRQYWDYGNDPACAAPSAPSAPPAPCDCSNPSDPACLASCDSYYAALNDYRKALDAYHNAQHAYWLWFTLTDYGYYDRVERRQNDISDAFLIAACAVARNKTKDTGAKLRNSDGTIAFATERFIKAITLTSGGSGYNSSTTVHFTGGGGSGATATATVSAEGVVTAVTLTHPGCAYTSVPSVTIEGAGSGAAATATIDAVVNQHFENILALERLLRASSPDPDHPVVDGTAMQMYIPDWACLTPDTSAGDENGNLRLNPRQLRGIADSVGQFTKYGDFVVCEGDMRMGVPTDCPEYLGSTTPNHEYLAMVDQCPSWASTNVNVAKRQEWQGRVYKAVVDALLADPKFSYLSFWGTVDKLNWLNRAAAPAWPYCPGGTEDPNETPYGDCTTQHPCYCNEQACNACILGARIDNSDPEHPRMVGHYYLKPAYYGLRSAICDYFGSAYSVRDADGKEVARFVENGNLLLMKKDSSVTAGAAASDWAVVDAAPLGSVFTVKNAAGDRVAALTKEDAHLYLNGDLHEQQPAPLVPISGGVAFEARFPINCPASEQDPKWKTAALIDDAGNLLLLGDTPPGTTPVLNEDLGNLRADGIVIAYGVPYTLENAHGSQSGSRDGYSVFQ